ncbi:hypothetical protein IC582_025248 [Cucumis melo]
MIITTHFIDYEWVLHKKILSFCQVANHKGETIGRAIESCLLEWGIDKIFTITVDNASSNDVAISYVKRRLKSWKSIVLDGELFHIRCCAHIINLIVNDGLKDMNDSIASVRNAVRYVRSSPKRMEKFKACVKQEKIQCKALVCLDVATRWNSTYLMPEHAIKFEKSFKILEEEKEDSDFVEYFKEDRGNKRLRPPSASDWLAASVFIRFLKGFYETTTKISGSSYVTYNVGYKEINKVQFVLEKWSNNNNSVLSLMTMNMKTKFDKYWGSLEKMNKLMFVAMVIDHRYKLKYLTYCLFNVYERDVVKDVVESVKIYLYRLYDFYKSQHSHSTQIGHSTDDLKQSNNVTMEVENDEEIDPWITFCALREEESSMEVENDLTSYLSDKDVVDKEEFDIMYWWKMNGYKYPILSTIVHDVLAVPISMVASESAFSTGGRILDSFCSSLTPKTVETLICTQNWIQGDSVLLDLHPQLEELETYENIEIGN